MAETTRKFKIGDHVEVTVAICEVSGWTGSVVMISDENSMPYLISFDRNLREWPFAEEELQHVYHKGTDEEADRCCPQIYPRARI